ncbi:MGMT family protein [Roseivirga echinicomitans]|uniref:Cysteine methyltransferase n=1 Tax=Roseivirga echinicomitans TaxID=296218 RepID=A0A150XUV4_9BACT|nr:MGMT family protein [Roseivirga echinicomitans]KYG82503.1 cysteine methyltransferase [Roseivirga echinicomitans]
MAKDHTNFFNNVYEVVKLIPAGRVTSYGAIAQYLGTKSGARMVGWAMNAAHGLSDVPAHRVVNRSGVLTGRHHFQTPTLMQERLEAEGVKVNDDKIEGFKEVYWEPIKELEL